MSHKTKFKFWINELFQIYNINPRKKELFHFTAFEDYTKEFNNEVFNIYEDWWITKPEIVKSKIKSILKISKRIFARQCIIKKIKKPESDLFLNENHLFGSAYSKAKYGLFYKDVMFGIATFAGQRQFRNGRSAELLRYCNKNEYTIVGGLDKLLNAYITNYLPDTIMTYVDLDWGKGDSFINLGFEAKETKLSLTFFVNKQTGERTPEKYFKDFNTIENYIKIKNSGSIKMVKTVSP